VERCAEGTTGLRFLSEDVLERIEASGDLFEETATLVQRLPGG
jgi:hypothetical protein